MDRKTGWTRGVLAAALAALLTLAAALSQADETITYIHWDAQGSPVAATDEDGNVVWRESYRPYGERIDNEPAAGPHTRWYTGHPQDEDTGLIYAGARYYDPVIGRFLAVDPVDFQEDNLHSFNRYAYGNNNPYVYVDPDGQFGVLAGIGVAIGLELLNLGLEIQDVKSNPCDGCVRSSGVGIPGGLGGAATKATGRMLRAVPKVTKKPHKNSLDYVGKTHVYRIKGPDGTYKIGESAQGTRMRDGASIRAEQQVRRLARETGDIYRSDIRRTFPDKRSARGYETRSIERFRRRYGQNALPGNKTTR